MLPAHRSTPSASLATFLKNRREGIVPTHDGIQRRSYNGSVEVSNEQRRLWLHCQLSGRSEIYNDIFSLRYLGELDLPALQKTVNEIVKRHEAWRTSFVLDGDKILQKVAPEVRVVLPVDDLRTVPAKLRQQRMSERIASEARTPFKLTDAPLFRARVIRIADREFRFVIVIHHLIGDGTSVYQVFLSELQSFYSAFSQGVEPAVPPLRFQYADYSEWQRQSLAGHGFDSALKFWDQHLKGPLPLTNLRFGKSRPIISKFDGGTQHFQLAKDIATSLKITADACGATVFMIAVAAFNVLAFRYTGESDQVFGCVTSTRKQFGTESLLGLFVNMLPLRSRFSADTNYLELVRQVRENTLAALEHEVPFDLLVRRFGRTLGISPLFQVVFAFEPSISQIAEQWQVEDRASDNPLAKWDLALILQEIGGCICGRFSYRLDLFASETIAKLRDSWVKLLSELAANPNRTVRELSSIL